jgi:hypothetical protein
VARPKISGDHSLTFDLGPIFKKAGPSVPLKKRFAPDEQTG